jgi:hypothetical protein
MTQARGKRTLGKRRATGLALLLFALLVLAAVLSCPLMTLTSLRQLDDHPLYMMRYYGPYTSEVLLRSGIEEAVYERIRQMAMPEACTCFAGLSAEGDRVFGRNFDWDDHPALLLFTDPPNGFASVSVVDIYYLGYDAEGRSEIGSAALLLAPLLPFDGMNEAGLAVGMMAVPHAWDKDDPQKPTVESLRAIRMLLDRASNTEQAIALLQEYDIVFAGPPLHYLISDASGDSAVVEFIDGQMKVITNDEPWQVATNFLLTEIEPDGANAPCRRYNAAYEALATANGSVSPSEAMDILQRVSLPSTLWSAVYDMTTGDVALVMGRDYDRVLTFHLPMRQGSPD